MKTLFNVEIHDARGRTVYLADSLDKHAAKTAAKRERPPLGASYVYRTNATDNTAATKADRKQGYARPLSFVNNGTDQPRLKFPKYRTSKVNISSKHRSTGTSADERQAKLIYEYYSERLQADPDRVFYIHRRHAEGYMSNTVLDTLHRLNQEYRGRVRYIRLDSEGFMTRGAERARIKYEADRARSQKPEAKRESMAARIADLAADLKPTVDKIESDTLPVTKDQYGDYLNLITRLASGDIKTAQIIVSALLEAGANRDGIAAAYKIYKG